MINRIEAQILPDTQRSLKLMGLEELAAATKR